MPTELTIIVYGRSASTLVLKMLYETGVFKLWGTPPAGECTPFRNKPQTWNRETIAKAWRKVYRLGDHVLAKLPTFAFFIDEILILEPSVIVLERNILDIVRSYIQVGWVPKLRYYHALFGVDTKAVKKYEELGGTLIEGDIYHLMGVVFAYSHWKTRKALMNYPGALTIYYQELMSKPSKVFIDLEEFTGLDPIYRTLWHDLMKVRHKPTGRPIELDYQTPLLSGLPPHTLKGIADAGERFK